VSEHLFTLSPVYTFPTFQGLAQKDYIGTFSLAKGISSREIKLSAILGACAGILAVSNGDSKRQTN